MNSSNKADVSQVAATLDAAITNLLSVGIEDGAVVAAGAEAIAARRSFSRSEVVIQGSRD